MPVRGVPWGVSFEEAHAELVREINALREETLTIYEELVLPCWGSTDRHGFPRTLYGLVMNTMALVDRLSC
jgi:hypothetical protein